MSTEITVKEILLEEYRFMLKSYELQFTHFMGVFYVWIPIVTLPTSAGILTNLISKPSQLGLLFCFTTIIGIFLSAKMFDIRRSQIRYLEITNNIRLTLWNKYKIEEQTSLKPIGKDVDLVKISLTDFGRTMAVTMSLVHGVLFWVGIRNILLNSSCSNCTIPLSIICSFIIIVFNIWLFYRIVGKRAKVR